MPNYLVTFLLSGEVGKGPPQKKTAQAEGNFEFRLGDFQITWARCKTPVQINAPTTVQKMGQGLIAM